jgi:flagellum-specific peptidoglycan hydrolase FlgJ
MKNTNITLAGVFLLLLTLFLQAGKPAYALQITSAKLETVVPVAQTSASQTATLKAYLESKNSPLAQYADVFVKEAQDNNLDWRLVAAISGLESSYGIHIPYNSYNGWGWGVYGDNVLKFTSWSDAIHTISSGLRKNYMDRGATDVYSIGRIYAASPTWADRVTYIMSQMEQFDRAKKATTLSISL